MPSFRSPQKQAERAVSRAMALGEARYESRDDGRVHSVGTARVYEQALTAAARWMQEHLVDRQPRPATLLTVN